MSYHFTMSAKYLSVILCIFTFHPTFQTSHTAYMEQRKTFLEKEAQRVIGSNLVLNKKEKKVDKIMLAVKEREFLRGFEETFGPTVNFLNGKPLVEKSTMFQMLKRMPKGGILHIHDVTIGNATWVIKHLTYLPHLYYCACGHQYCTIRFIFATTPLPHTPANCVTEWVSVAEARGAIGAQTFDQMLIDNITMATPTPDQSYPNTTMAWKRFNEVYYPVSDLFFSTSAFRSFMWHNLERMVQDNVQYVEIRTTLQPIRNLDGSLCTREDTLQQFIEVFEDFVEEYPQDFIGGKLIYVAERFPFLEVEVGNKLSVATEFRKKYPSYFAGYDLAGQEDIGYPLIDYIDTLLLPSQSGFDLPFFFHAGETDWDGEEVDINLVDAVLLNSTRIGHGYAVNKHPVVRETIKSKGIAIELNPISNQVLHLVHDIRDHVGAGLIADGYPVVISSDDPGLWDALPLSHDFYMAFMGMSAKDDGLSLLKQLALNSFKYSAMTDVQQIDALKLWQTKWDRFLDEIIEEYSSDSGFEEQSNDFVHPQKRLIAPEAEREQTVSSETFEDRWLMMIENIFEVYRKNNET